MVWTPRGCGKLIGYTLVWDGAFGHGSESDAGGLARSDSYTLLNQIISRVVKSI